MADISLINLGHPPMIKPPLPFDETVRLLSLHSLRILDTPAERRFDRITRMAQRVFGVDVCLVSLVDSDRQWFKSKQGLEACETSREISFCGHAILDKEILIVEDTKRDVRFQDNPLVTHTPFIRFYAGCPIYGPNDHSIGTLCLIDAQPRELSAPDQETLRDLAAMVEDELRVNAQATKDELTQIANRRGFNLVANYMLSLCRRSDIQAELIYFDLDGFKKLNDTLGHKAGDDILKHFAKLLIKCFRTADVVARLGGDEFVVLLTANECSSEQALDRLKQLETKYRCPSTEKLGWSVGTVKFEPSHHTCVDNLLADADALMYQNKSYKKQSSGS